MRKSILMPHGLMRRARLKRENSRTVLPRLIRMSFRQSIPWRVALQQSPPPLPLPRSSSTENHPFANGISANGNRPLPPVSQFLTQSRIKQSVPWAFIPSYDPFFFTASETETEQADTIGA